MNSSSACSFYSTSAFKSIEPAQCLYVKVVSAGGLQGSLSQKTPKVVLCQTKSCLAGPGRNLLSDKDKCWFCLCESKFKKQSKKELPCNSILEGRKSESVRENAPKPPRSERGVGGELEITYKDHTSIHSP